MIILLCDCCHSEYEVSEDLGGEQLCPDCLQEFVIDPFIRELEEECEELPDIGAYYN